MWYIRQHSFWRVIKLHLMRRRIKLEQCNKTKRNLLIFVQLNLWLSKSNHPIKKGDFFFFLTLKKKPIQLNLNNFGTNLTQHGLFNHWFWNEHLCLQTRFVAAPVPSNWVMPSWMGLKKSSWKWNITRFSWHLCFALPL